MSKLIRSLTIALSFALFTSWSAVQAQDNPTVVAVTTGDSIEAGAGSGHEAEMDGGPSGDISAELGYQLQRKLGKSWTYKDYAKGSTGWDWIAHTALGLITSENPKEIWI